MKNLSRVPVILWVGAVSALLALGTVGLSVAGDKDHHDDMAKEVTLEGEVLDLYCFMMHPEDGQGPDHAKCAQSCINKGLPIGFMAKDGEVYVLIGKDHDPVADMVAQYAGMQSRLKGKMMMHHGLKAIEVASIEPLKS